MESVPKERADSVKELEYTGKAIPKGRRFCTLCGGVKRETAFEADSTHCKDCCEKMLHTHVHGYAFLSVALVVAALAAAVYLGVNTFPIVKQAHTADSLAADCALYDAVEAYEKVFDAVDERNEAAGSTWYCAGLRTWEAYYDVYAGAYSANSAADDAAERLDKSVMQNSAQLSALLEIKQVNDAIRAQVTAIGQEYQAETADDLPYEKVLGKLSAIEVDGDERLVKGYLELFKADLAQYCNPDKPEIADAFYEKALAYLPEETMMISVNRAQCALNAEQYESVLAPARQIIEGNRNDTDAYGWLAEAYYSLGKKADAMAVLEELQTAVPDTPLYYMLRVKYAVRDGDFDLAETLCNRQDEANSETADAAFNTLLARDTLPKKAERIFLESINYSLWEAALMLLQGDEESAFNIAYNYAFNYAYYYEYITGKTTLNQRIVNMTTLCAELCKGKDDEVQEAKTVLSQVGLCDEQTQQIIDGKISLQEAFVEGKVDWL